MERKPRNDDVLMKDLNALVRDLVDELDDAARRITSRRVALSLQHLRNTVDGMEDAPIVRRATPLERYTREWTEHIGGGESLEGKAIRFLCWVPEIATDVRFLAAMERSGTTLNRRTLAGLVRSCHCMWEHLPPDSEAVRIIAGFLHRYGGGNRILKKWQANSAALLAPDGPRIMADKLVGGGRDLASFIDEWRIAPLSAYLGKVVGYAAATCRGRLDRLDGSLPALLFRDLLPWPGWNPSAFKKEIGAVIQHQPMSDRAREMIRKFVLHFAGLGDPRLSANLVKWNEVPGAAKDRLTGWLRRENPYVFSEHVYQQGEGWVWRQRASLHDPLSFEDAAGQ